MTPIDITIEANGYEPKVITLYPTVENEPVEEPTPSGKSWTALKDVNLYWTLSAGKMQFPISAGGYNYDNHPSGSKDVSSPTDNIVIPEGSAVYAFPVPETLNNVLIKGALDCNVIVPDEFELVLLASEDSNLFRHVSSKVFQGLSYNGVVMFDWRIESEIDENEVLLLCVYRESISQSTGTLPKLRINATAWGK